jgi:CHASE3 domain sensor protein
MGKDSPGTNKGCMYKSDSEAICNYLSEIVNDRDNTMHNEFEAQNTLIREHNKEVINLLTAQHTLIREIRTDLTDNVKTKLRELENNEQNREKRLKLLEKYAGWQETSVRIFLAVAIAVILTVTIHKLFF